ncbi:MerR family transcriptional regulator [Actinoplanes sp. HUAS TT8]|uniref:helix-turn-helix domain-containing protein n=1 Tax=Actinoplanes sp. HUAS TT8 TaxID=3447453 RepID=UPI003F51C673
MAWSTRELAQLAGTSLRAVRHYHEIGLLDEPVRRSNGYKVYRTEHLVRLVQIRRLTELGFSLAQIATMDETGPAGRDEAIRAVDDELTAAIARLEQARAELAEFRRHAAPPDMPPRLSAAASDAGLSPADRSFYAVLAQLFGAQSTEHWRDLVRSSHRDAAAEEFDALTEDADDAVRENLARRFAERAAAVSAEHPPPAALTVGPAAGEALIQVLLDVYNPAQLDVLRRMWQLLGYL